MRNYICVLIFTIGMLFFTACNPQPIAPFLLKQAEQLLDEDKPDSAMLLIDSIFYPDKSLKEKEYMRYLVSNVRAKYKTYRDISEDTLIFQAKYYFKRQGKDHKLIALALFYSGCVYREQGQYKQAMEHYKNAGNHAAKTTDTELQGLVHNNMGDLFAVQGLHAEALKNYRLAQQLYRPFPSKQLQSLSAMGQMYQLTDEPDSAFFYFHKGLEMAKSTKDQNLQSLPAQNLSVAYSEKGEYEKAETYLRLSFETNRDTTDLLLYYLSFAEIYLQQKEMDSADLYVHKLKLSIDKSNNTLFKVSAYGFLSNWEKTHTNYDEAFLYQIKQMDALVTIMEERKKQSVYEVQQKYDFEQIKNQYNSVMMARQQLIIILQTIALCAGILAVLLFRRVVLQKNKLLKMQEAMQILKETAKDLLKSQSKLKSNEEKWRETLLWKFNIQQKASQLTNLTTLTDKTNNKKLIIQFEKIVYGKNGESQWDLICGTIEELNPGLQSFIRNNWPRFSDTEFKACVLSYTGLRSKEIALILNQSHHTINMARTHIRKKMKIQEEGGNFCVLLKELFSQQT